MEISLSKDKTKIQITQEVKEVPVEEYVKRLVAQRDALNEQIAKEQIGLKQIKQ